jgi:hypothetical protein
MVGFIVLLAGVRFMGERLAGSRAVAAPSSPSTADASSPSVTPGEAVDTLQAVPTPLSTTHASPGVATSSPPPDPTPSNVYAHITEGLSPTVRRRPRAVYVPNGRPGTVRVIDPRTYRVVDSFWVGGLAEHVSPSHELRWLYVEASAADALGVIDPSTGRLVRTIHGIDHPYNLYFTLDGSRAIVVAEYYDRLDFRNPRTWRLVKSVPLPCYGSDHLGPLSGRLVPAHQLRVRRAGGAGEHLHHEGHRGDGHRRQARRRQALP